MFTSAMAVTSAHITPHTAQFHSTYEGYILPVELNAFAFAKYATANADGKRKSASHWKKIHM
jgi:hypothetical protein